MAFETTPGMILELTCNNLENVFYFDDFHTAFVFWETLVENFYVFCTYLCLTCACIDSKSRLKYMFYFMEERPKTILSYGSSFFVELDK